MAVPASRAAADVLRDYQAAIQDSDRAIRAVGDPDARFAVPVDGSRHTLRWVMAPHDERDRAARRTRRHPPGAARRHYRSLNPASAALAASCWIKDATCHQEVRPHRTSLPHHPDPGRPASSPLPTPLPDDLRVRTN
jgi:hypothetical protein